jgi:hypothetical protein
VCSVTLRIRPMSANRRYESLVQAKVSGEKLVAMHAQPIIASR